MDSNNKIITKKSTLKNDLNIYQIEEVEHSIDEIGKYPENNNAPFDSRNDDSINKNEKNDVVAQNTDDRVSNLKQEIDADEKNNPNEQESEDSDYSQNLEMNNYDGTIEIIEGDDEFNRAKLIHNFFDGRPRTEEDILRMECPLYKVGRNTIVRRSHMKVNRKTVDSNERTENIETRKKSKTIKLITRNKTRNDSKAERTSLYSDNNKLIKGKTTAVDINMANTLHLKTFDSLFMTILSIINCIIRYTLIQFPFCIKIMGLIWGPIIITIIGSMSIFSIYLLIRLKEKTNSNSYSAFAFKWWGLSGKIFIIILNFIQSFGSCLSYIIIFLKIVPKLLNIGVGDFFFTDKKLLSVILAIILMIYCFQKDISGIKSAAYWGVLGIILYLILDIINLLYSSWIENIPENKELNFMFFDWLDYDFWSCVACIILSFSFHTYAFYIYDCLEEPDEKKMIVTSSIGIFISMLIYLLTGTIGYILYGEKITDSILDSLGFSSLGVLENIAFIVNVVMSFPLTFNALKHYYMFLVEIFVTIIRDKCKKRTKGEALIEHKKNDIETSDHDQDHDNDHLKGQNSLNHKHNHSSNHNSNDHLDLVHIPEWIEFILLFFLFFAIFYIAYIAPNIKIVKLKLNNHINRYLGFLVVQLQIFSVLFYLLCFSSNFLIIK